MSRATVPDTSSNETENCGVYSRSSNCGIGVMGALFAKSNERMVDAQLGVWVVKFRVPKHAIERATDCEINAREADESFRGDWGVYWVVFWLIVRYQLICVQSVWVCWWTQHKLGWGFYFQINYRHYSIMTIDKFHIMCFRFRTLFWEFTNCSVVEIRCPQVGYLRFDFGPSQGHSQGERWSYRAKMFLNFSLILQFFYSELSENYSPNGIYGLFNRLHFE